jgi:hypothetical protein
MKPSAIAVAAASYILSGIATVHVFSTISRPEKRFCPSNFFKKNLWGVNNVIVFCYLFMSNLQVSHCRYFFLLAFLEILSALGKFSMDFFCFHT